MKLVYTSFCVPGLRLRVQDILHADDNYQRKAGILDLMFDLLRGRPSTRVRTF